MESMNGPLGSETVSAIRAAVRRGVQEGLVEAGLAPKDPDIASRWEFGQLILKPGKEGLQEKSISIDSFFHKIVMVRERLRVLEQKINSHPKLEDVDRVELQDYITRVYGSLTTFNILFADREDWFVGSTGERS